MEGHFSLFDCAFGKGSESRGMVASSSTSFDRKFRELLDCFDDLRRGDVMNIGIQIPSIVVIGDQSTGKSSVLESLAQVNLPKGDGMCTRMPLVLQMKDHSSPTLDMELVLNENRTPVTEESVEQKIREISNIQANEGISDKEIYLIMRRKGMANLTLIDLPGIFRVPTPTQPSDIEKQILDLIYKYIRQKDNIILNVIQAGADFSINQSIKMSQEVDKEGKRTLAVVTKADQNIEGLAQKLKNTAVKVGLGYVCVRNRLNEESYTAARDIESKLFKHPSLSDFDRSMFGISSLKNKLLQNQERQIRECLPRISAEIQKKLVDSTDELNLLPMLRKENVEKTFDDLMEKSMKSLDMILVKADFREYPKKDELHCTFQILKKIKELYDALKKKFPDQFPALSSSQASDIAHPDEVPRSSSSALKDQYPYQVAGPSPSQASDPLDEELYQLQQTQGPWLPGTFPRNARNTMLHERVEEVRQLPEDFIGDVMKKIVLYAVEKVIADKFHTYNLMKEELKKAANIVSKKKKNLLIQRMKEMVEMERYTDYTCNPEYERKLEELKKHKDSCFRPYQSKPDVSKEHLEDAFKLKIEKAAYWSIVIMRMVDVSAMHLWMTIKKLMDGELKSEIRKEALGIDNKGLEKMTSETAETAEQRKKLEERIYKLKIAKEKVTSVLGEPA